MTPSMKTREPSLRMCQRTSGAVPWSRAIARSLDGSPIARSSGVNVMSVSWPIASSSLHPKTAAAPGDQLVMRPSTSDIMIA